MLSAQQHAKILRNSSNAIILGPEFHLNSRIQLYYQLVIRVKLSKTTAPDYIKGIINNAIDRVKNQENNSSVHFINDVDPF